MSQTTPSKRDRIDRHLSRQRGAGVRNLATSFGFSFGLSTVTVAAGSATHGVPVQEPSPKRRKLEQVVEEKENVEPEHHGQRGATQVEPRTALVPETGGAQGHKPEEVEETTNPKTSKVGRSKTTQRRGRKVNQTQRTDITSTASRSITRRASPRELQAEPELELDKSIPARRPRRQAATDAMSKVAQGFVEEEAPIDKKRRDPEPEKVARKSRKKTVGDQETEMSGRKPAPARETVRTVVAQAHIDEVRTDSVPQKAKTRRGSKPKAARVTVTSGGLLENGSAAIDEHIHVPTKRARIDKEELAVASEKAQRIRVKKAAVLQDPVNDQLDLESIAVKQFECIVDERAPDSIFIRSDDTASRPVRSENLMLKRTGGQASTKIHADGAKSARKPLAETDANITLRSLSPEKFDKPVKNPRQTSCAKTMAPKVSDKQTKKGRVHVKRGEACAGDDFDDSGDAAKGQEHTDTQVSGEASKRPTSRPPRAEGIPRGHRPAHDEDVDWLFDEKHALKKPRSARRVHAPVGVVTKRVTRPARAKMPEVDLDLDDLLTDIASMAHRKGRQK